MEVLGDLRRHQRGLGKLLRRRFDLGCTVGKEKDIVLGEDDEQTGYPLHVLPQRQNLQQRLHDERMAAADAGDHAVDFVHVQHQSGEPVGTTGIVHRVRPSHAFSLPLLVVVLGEFFQVAIGSRVDDLGLVDLCAEFLRAGLDDRGITDQHRLGELLFDEQVDGTDDRVAFAV